MNKKLIILVGIVAVFAVFAQTNRNNTPKEQTVQESVKSAEDATHIHAGFQLYINDNLQDLSDFQYMHFESCSEHEEAVLTEEEEQIEKAHLHDFVGDVVHVHRENAVWGDLFKNINFEVAPDEVYVNGELLAEDFLSLKIMPYDSIVAFQGENDDISGKLAGAVTKERIEEVESTSEYCGR